MIREHSAKVLTALCDDGHTRHYMLIGGYWRYAGTNEFTITKGSKDGFWNESITACVNSGTKRNLKELVEGYGMTKVRTYIRSWTSDTAKVDSPF